MPKDATDRILDELVGGPGVSKMRLVAYEPLSKPRTIAQRKGYLEQLLRLCELDGKGRGAEAARILRIDRSTLFGWRDPLALNRGPTDEAFETLEQYAQWQAGNRRFARSA